MSALPALHGGPSRPSMNAPQYATPGGLIPRHIDTPPAPLRFAGYAALFHSIDGAHDQILPGAFAKSLAEQGDSLPLFWEHSPERPIGRCNYVREDQRGLRVIGALDNPASRYAEALRAQQISGLSFGFRARRSHMRGKVRVLMAIDIFEISIVERPLQHGARIHLIP